MFSCVLVYVCASERECCAKRNVDSRNAQASDGEASAKRIDEVKSRVEFRSSSKSRQERSLNSAARLTGAKWHGGNLQ